MTDTPTTEPQPDTPPPTTDMVHVSGAVVPTAAASVVRYGASATDLDLLKRTVARKLDQDEVALFDAVCRRTGLDPFVKQIYAIKRWDGKEQKEVMGIQTSIDGFRLIAERTGQYQGQTPHQWCGDDGAWVDVWLSADPPRAARVGVLRAGFTFPLYGIALWEEYRQTVTRRGGTPALAPMWERMPAHMLGKCAESLALRAAFPAELSGIYTSDEMSQARLTPDRGEDDDLLEARRQIAECRAQLTEDEKNALRAWITAEDIEPVIAKMSLDDAMRVWTRAAAMLADRDVAEGTIDQPADAPIAPADVEALVDEAMAAEHGPVPDPEPAAAPPPAKPDPMPTPAERAEQRARRQVGARAHQTAAATLEAVFDDETEVDTSEGAR